MKNHNFCYNYGFLADWLKSNPSVQRYGLLEMLDMSYYRTLQNWINGKTMMPLTQMMKFCNLFNVPITAFFFDELADEDSIFTPIPQDAMIEPAGGWKAEDQALGPKSCDPRTPTHTDSFLPSYIRSVNTEKTSTYTPDDAVTNDERMKYLDIIKSLSDQLKDLSNENARLKSQTQPQLKSYYGMVAEDEL